jgi:hypothetical protein
MKKTRSKKSRDTVPLNILKNRKSSLLLSAARLAENELGSGNDDRPLPVRLSLPSIYVTQPTSQPGKGTFAYKKLKLSWLKRYICNIIRRVDIKRIIILIFQFKVSFPMTRFLNFFDLFAF